MRDILRTVCLAAGLSLAAAGFGIAAQPAKPAKPAQAPAKAAPAKAAPAWVVDKAQSSVRFLSSFGGVPIDDHFNRWDAQINFDPANLPGSKAVVSVETGSVVSDDRDRSASLPTAEWFNSPRFPRATFASTGFRHLGGAQYQATGTLTLKGVSTPVVFPFTLTMQGDQAKVTGQFAIMRNRFKIGEGQFSGSETIPYEVRIPVAITARRAR